MSIDGGLEKMGGGTWIQVFSAVGYITGQTFRGQRWSWKLGVIKLKVKAESMRGEKLRGTVCRKKRAVDRALRVHFQSKAKRKKPAKRTEKQESGRLETEQGANIKGDSVLYLENKPFT